MGNVEKLGNSLNSFVRDCLKDIFRHYSSLNYVCNLSYVHMMILADTHIRAKGEDISMISLIFVRDFPIFSFIIFNDVSRKKEAIFHYPRLTPRTA